MRFHALESTCEERMPKSDGMSNKKLDEVGKHRRHVDSALTKIESGIKMSTIIRFTTPTKKNDRDPQDSEGDKGLATRQLSR